MEKNIINPKDIYEHIKLFPQNIQAMLQSYELQKILKRDT